jgi:hypothetical protein
MIGDAIDHVYDMLDALDATLRTKGGEYLSDVVELANLSSIIGNLFRGGIVKHSGGAFAANKPHTYPDLLGRGPGCKDVEIKMALETKKPKGHLIKPGPHLTIRYVLADDAGAFVRGKENRGKVCWIWEVRVGALAESHFNVSNTAGDSGKTAVINAEGMKALEPVLIDLDLCPHSKKHARYKEFATLFGQPVPSPIPPSQPLAAVRRRR